MSEYSHTFELLEVSDACAELISHNAEHLINYIYENTDKPPYNDRTVRIGLVLKTLLKPGNNNVTVSTECVEPATKDLTDLINETSNQVEKKIYIEELQFLRSCTILDDLISLNTAPQH